MEIRLSLLFFTHMVFLGLGFGLSEAWQRNKEKQIQETALEEPQVSKEKKSATTASASGARWMLQTEGALIEIPPHVAQDPEEMKRLARRGRLVQVGSDLEKTWAPAKEGPAPSPSTNEAARVPAATDLPSPRQLGQQLQKIQQQHKAHKEALEGLMKE